MKQTVTQKDAEWVEWLERYGLHDVVIGEDANYLKYLKLSKMTFPVVPREDWGPYLQNLVALEPGLVFQDIIGLAGNTPFTLILTNPTPVCQKPIVYPRVEH